MPDNEELGFAVKTQLDPYELDFKSARMIGSKPDGTGVFRLASNGERHPAAWGSPSMCRAVA